MNNKEVAKLATKALLYEVTISPKAGLVSRLSNGSHRDMDFYTFIDSALSLSKYFSECFIYGQENDFYSPNFFKNLRDLGKKAENKYEDVLREIPRVRKDLGYPPLVTPLSQMVGTQAIFNILTGQRYKLIPNEIKNYVRGLYGKSPVPISDEIKKTIIFNEEVFTGRPADKLAAEYDKMVEETRDFARSEEDVLSYALFPQVAKDFLIKKYGNE